MSRKERLPVIDHIRKMISDGCPVDAALFSAEAVERQCIADAKVSIRDKELLKKWREKDAARKRKIRRASGGQSESELFRSTLPQRDSNIEVKKEKIGKNPSGGRSAGRPTKGIELPSDWQPSPGHYREAERAGLSHADVDRVAERMRHWAVANRHRSEARKADLDGWNAAFSGTWLGKEIDSRRSSPQRQTGASKLAQMAFHGRSIDG